MRRLIAVVAALVTALTVLTLGLAGPAAADITAPAEGAVLRSGGITISASGAGDGTLCATGSGPQTTLQLVDSGGTAVVDSVQGGTGAKSVTFDSRSFPNGSYVARAIERNRSGLIICSNSTKTTERKVKIDNFTELTITSAPTSAPQNTSISVSARLTDGNDGSNVADQPVTFSLSDGSSVNATTNANGVATATLTVNAGPRDATITASFADTSHWRGSTATSDITVTKNGSKTTLTPPGPVVFGQPTSLTATVAATNGSSTPTGSVQFTVDGANHGTPVSINGSGVATLGGVLLPAGSHTVGATYSGDDDHDPSTATTVTQVVDRASTSTILTSTGSPTVSGQAVTFTATVDVVAPGVGNPTGAVQFNVDGRPVGTAVPLDGDTAQLTVSNLSAGNHEVSATYNGDDNFAGSTSNTVTHGVDRADTTLSLSSSTPHAVAGEPLTFTAEVSVVAPGAGTPTGAVQFFVDGNELGGPVALSNGVATSPTAHLGAGDHVVTADYEGDARYAGASASIDQDVEAAQTATTVSAAPSPSAFGQRVTIRAEVTPQAPATGSPQGVVRFIVDGTTVGFVELVDGAAEYQVDTLSVGAHTFQARYVSEDPNFVTSLSQEVDHQVNKAATRTVVTSSGSPSVFGQPVTFTASVSVVAPGAGDPSGNITFTDGSTVLGTQPVSSATGGQASITVSDLSVAQHAVTATYTGDDSFTGSNGSVTQKVNRAQTSTVLTSSANPSASGQGVTFTATVSPVAPGAGDPTGTVRFTVNGAQLGGARPVVDGVATSPTFNSLTPGVYRIEAVYSGDGSFLASTGALDQGAAQEVVKGDVQVALTSDQPTSAYGQPITFTATVDAVPPANRRPTGVVQFWEGGVLLGATSLEPGEANQGVASFVSSTLSPGTHDVRAVYVGNFNYNGGTASTSQVVGVSATVTGVRSSANPITFGESVTLTAVVSEVAPTPGVPTGSVTFTRDGNVLGTAELVTVDGRREASITLDDLAAGTHDVTATYSGDATFAASGSTPYSQMVAKAPSNLQAKVIIRELGDNGGRVRATLHGVDGAPLAGETLVFDTTQNSPDRSTIHICTVTTDEDGYAECDATALLAAIVLDGGYDVHFAGNANYLPADDHETYFGEND